MLKRVVLGLGPFSISQRHSEAYWDQVTQKGSRKARKKIKPLKTQIVETCIMCAKIKSETKNKKSNYPHANSSSPTPTLRTSGDLLFTCPFGNVLLYQPAGQVRFVG